MVIDVGYLKRVTKRILTLALTLIRSISCIQNGSILYAIFDCICHINHGRTSHKMVFQKNKDTKEAKCDNCTNISICDNCRSFSMGDSGINR